MSAEAFLPTSFCPIATLPCRRTRSTTASATKTRWTGGYRCTGAQGQVGMPPGAAARPDALNVQGRCCSPSGSAAAWPCCAAAPLLRCMCSDAAHPLHTSPLAHPLQRPLLGQLLFGRKAQRPTNSPSTRPPTSSLAACTSLTACPPRRSASCAPTRSPPWWWPATRWGGVGGWVGWLVGCLLRLVASYQVGWMDGWVACQVCQSSLVIGWV